MKRRSVRGSREEVWRDSWDESGVLTSGERGRTLLAAIGSGLP